MLMSGVSRSSSPFFKAFRECHIDSAPATLNVHNIGVIEGFPLPVDDGVGPDNPVFTQANAITAICHAKLPSHILRVSP